MKIVADENIPRVEDAFSRFGDVRVLSGRQIVASDAHDADVLLVRSVTRVNQPLLENSSVRFVGSATIGTDHVDQAWLGQQHIRFANAPGCNAISAAEYVVSALFSLYEKNATDLQNKTIGIVGCGNVGSRVKLRAEALGIKCLVCDPPRADAEGLQGFVDMHAIAQCDIVTVHVPLIEDGPYPTRQLINGDFLSRLNPDAVFINTSRGDVVDETALLDQAMSSDIKLVLDVWENEPLVNKDLVQRTQIATPHIAGYSLDGKIRATSMLYQALCEHLGESIDSPAWCEIPSPEDAVIDMEGLGEVIPLIQHCLAQVYNIRRDDVAMRQSMEMSDNKRAAEFDRLRKHYWPRRECSAYRVPAEGLSTDALNALAVYGFTVT